MDLKEKIINYLDSKNYDNLAKVRWIYLYVCRIFSYDARYNFLYEHEKDELYKKEVNIEDVNEYEFVCYTIAKILKDALDVCGFNAEIVKETNKERTHVFVVLKVDGYMLKLDPTKRHDITRVKMHSSTLDFKLYNNDDLEEDFMDELKMVDKQISSDYKPVDLSVFYNDETIAKLVETIEKSAIDRNISEHELFYEKLDYLFNLVNIRTDLKRYDDMDYYMSYLIRKFKLNKGKVHLRPCLFFKNGDKKLGEIINIIYIEYSNYPPMFYVMKKENDKFNVREIFKDEALELLSEYENPILQYYFEEKAKKLPKESMILKKH